MKQEEKAKRYDEAIKVAKSKIKNDKDHVLYEDDIIEIFPELKESEDERILKNLKAVVKAYDMWAERGLDMNDILAWLEKQGEQKQTVIIPRFRVGDVITSTKNSALKYKIKAVGVLNELGEYDYVVEDVTDTDYKGRIHEMSISKVDEWGVVVEQKSAWSEEGKRKMYRIYSILGQAADTHAFSTTCRLIGDKECIELQDFLKSLTPQSTWKPSDEQMRELGNAKDSHFDLSYKTKDALKSLYKDLKKLKK